MATTGYQLMQHVGLGVLAGVVVLVLLARALMR
jgi:hypothetical protein